MRRFNTIKRQIRSRRQSFRYAFLGLKNLIDNEVNFVIHLLCALLVIMLGFWFRISSSDWALLIIVIGAVLVTEAINSAIERLCDVVSPAIHPQIKMIKDIMAGAVLITAIAALLVGILVFYKYVFVSHAWVMVKQNPSLLTFC